ncbi:carboxymuconolactone decarboxylase family protein [Paenibacillus radicis (ex Xue et al. 2023)]|uniref:Carboxymuconolactone decarboxylase family protein n=1 Tax=Paenibacillus radicis (ex Xue et al. 2023) TaxID=2972489 RepID=A0ABT1YN52_9BACL|nr:carboxymuconolactone decarboxylase family protein [Paenibacillus radicis (ex Xue et al. 2023)]MCR8633718.1 carboxymuconolactone decarboxylase family protein [Paenibacillus radicis (ex Xue et al. 2023)]
MSSYYDKTDLQRIPELVKLAPHASAAFFAFEQEVYHSSSILPVKIKELIAIVTAHITGCPYCIDVHVRKFKELGGTMEEIVEALLTAASTRAGAILSHGVHAIKAFEAYPGKEPASSVQQQPDSSPSCYC